MRQPLKHVQSLSCRHFGSDHRIPSQRYPRRFRSSAIAPITRARRSALPLAPAANCSVLLNDGTSTFSAVFNRSARCSPSDILQIWGMDPQRQRDLQERSSRDGAKNDTMEVEATGEPFVSLSAVPRSGRYGTLGKKIELSVNNYRAELSIQADTICHFDLTFRSSRIEDPNAGGRGGRGGRGRGRGGRGGSRRPPAPDEKAPPLRIAMQLLREIELKNVGTKFPSDCKLAYDGRKNVYSSIAPEWRVCSFTSDFEEKRYEVEFRLAAEVPMDRLKQYLARENLHLPQDAINVLDIAMRTRPLRECVLTGRSFSLPNNFNGSSGIDKVLGYGCEAWRGYYQALRPIEAGLSLSFDVSYSAFYIEQNLYDFAVDILKPRRGNDLTDNLFPGGFSPVQHRILRNELRGLRVEQPNLPAGQRKEKVIDDLSTQSARRLEFPEERSTRMKTVEEYFAECGNALRYPDLPCVEVAGKKGKPTYIPLEMARLAAGQRRTKSMNGEMTGKLIQIASRSPDLRRSDIEAMLEIADHNADEYLQAFGVKVDTTPMKVTARVLDPPRIQYKDLEVVLSPDSQELLWNVSPGRQLFRTRNKLRNWGVLVLAPTVKDVAVENFVKCLQRVCVDAGLQVDEPRYKYGYNQAMLENMKALAEQVSSAVGECQLILVVKQDLATHDYNRVKMIGDTVLGIPTQCVVQGHVENPREAYCQNVMLKINAKLGGVNVRVRPDAFETHIGDSPWMVVGADVSHAPAADAKDGASVASCVATMDRSCSSHVGKFRLQDPKTETIKDIGPMVHQLLLAFNNRNGFFPQKIIVYRDGVSEGQFATVLSEEVGSIKEEFARIGKDFETSNGYHPSLTYVILQKRHHTRFFPTSDQEKDVSGNCLAGTVVDSVVTHPENYDFYLISHNGLQGVSRPVRYTVLYDENNIGPDNIQSLTYNMCFSYARCTRTVSVVPVAYYADLLAARGRAYLSSRKFAQNEAAGGRGLRGDSTSDALARMGEPVVHAQLTERLFYI